MKESCPEKWLDGAFVLALVSMILTAAWFGDHGGWRAIVLVLSFLGLAFLTLVSAVSYGNLVSKLKRERSNLEKQMKTLEMLWGEAQAFIAEFRPAEDVVDARLTEAALEVQIYTEMEQELFGKGVGFTGANSGQVFHKKQNQLRLAREHALEKFEKLHSLAEFCGYGPKTLEEYVKEARKG